MCPMAESSDLAFPANSDLSALKVPPHSEDAEQAVLGGLMQDNTEWESIAERLLTGDFYRAEHQRIYAAMQRQSETGQPIDVVTLAESLNSHNELQAAGGVDYLGDLAANARGTANIKAYADIIRERALLRRLISTANSIANSGYNTEGRSAQELLDEAEGRVLKIQDERARDKGPQPAVTLVSETMDHLTDLAKSKDGIIGVRSGYVDLDKLTAGWQPDDFIVVAGRPSMGKTAFAMNLVENALLKLPAADDDESPPDPVLVFSLEMPSSQLMLRMVSSVGCIDHARLRSGQLSQDEWDQVPPTMKRLKELPLYIDDTPGLSPMDMQARARRVKREHGGKLGMVVVDYLQLMYLKDTRENRVNEISEISRSLKLMARGLGCPLIALSQLNRGLENRPNKRPMLFDLRESGAIEQDADVILFLYRDEKYDEDSEDKGIAEVIIGKQRNGPTGTVRLSFLDQFTRFENFAPPRYDESFTHE